MLRGRRCRPAVPNRMLDLLTCSAHEDGMALRCSNVRPHEAHGDERNRAGATGPSCGPPAWRPRSRGTAFPAGLPRSWEQEATLGHLRERVFLARAPGLLSSDHAQKEPPAWAAKITANKSRDRRVGRELREAGFSVLVVWECQTVGGELLARRLRRFFRRLDATAALERADEGRVRDAPAPVRCGISEDAA